MKDFLKDTLDLGRDDVFKVDVKEGFSFFNTDGEHTEKVMSVLNGFDMNGRRINVEISKNDGGSRERRDHNGRSSGGFGGGRSSGGFRGGNDRNERSSGGFRSGGDRSSAPRSGGFGPRKESGSSERPAREGGFRSDRNDAPKREPGASQREERAPRRSEGSSDRPASRSFDDAKVRRPRRS